MNRVGVSTGSFYDMEIYTEEAIQYTRKLGVQKVELFIQSREELKSDFLHLLMKKLKSQNIIVNSIHPFMEGYEVPNLFSKNKRKFKDGLNLFYRYLEACKILETKNIVMHGPLKNSDYSFNRLNELISIANDYDIDICIENKEYTIFHSPHQFKKFESYCTSNNYQFVLDFKSSWKAGHNPLDFLKVFQSKLKFVHISFKDEKRNYYGNNYISDDRDIFKIICELENRYKELNYIVEVFETLELDQIKKSVDYINYSIRKAVLENE